jgi:hypothetical protein
MGLAVAGAATAVGGGAVLLGARALRDGVGPGTPQRTVDETNRKVATRQRTAVLLLGAGGAALAGAAALLLWPGGPATLSLSPDGVTVALKQRF